MSAMPAAQSGSTMQLQKHAAVTEAVQSAFVTVVYCKVYQNLNDSVCLWLP